MKVKELEERLEPSRELEKKFKKENKTKKVEAEGKGPTIEKMEAKLTQMDQRIANMSLQAEDKENNKEVALGTSKIVSIGSGIWVLLILILYLELHRPQTDSRILQEVQCPDRKVLLQNTKRKIRLGHQVR